MKDDHQRLHEDRMGPEHEDHHNGSHVAVGSDDLEHEVVCVDPVWIFLESVVKHKLGEAIRAQQAVNHKEQILKVVELSAEHDTEQDVGDEKRRNDAI